MKSKEFIQNCIVTESNDFNAIRERLKDKHLLNALSCLLHDFTYFAEELDKLKKFIFYGKPLPNEGEPYLAFYDFEEKELAIEPSVKTIRLLHGILGIATETGELTFPLEKHLFEGAELDEVNLLEELGDGDWYKSIVFDSLGEDSFEPTWEKIVNKLKARYGTKFDANSAINRNLEAERAILEGNA
jgi:NTP pyrophosphatase (non-canonical NTP hydrolase)